MSSEDKVSAPKKTAKSRILLFSAIAWISAVAIYGCTLSFDFIWDDCGVITHNQDIRSIRTAIDSFWRSRDSFKDYDPSQMTHEIYRPLRTVAHSVLYKYWGLNPLPYHAANILAHATVAVLAFLLFWRLMGNAGAALCGGLVFALHPVNTEVVCWAKSLEDLFAALFVLGSLHLFLSALAPRKGTLPLWLGAGILYALALFAKASVIFFPVFLVGFLCIRLLKLPGMTRLPAPRASAWAFCGACGILGMAFLCIRHIVMGKTAQGAFITGNCWTTWLSMPRVFLRYMRLEFVPVDLLADYEAYPYAHKLSEFTPWLFAILFVLIFCGITWLLIRARSGLGLCAWLWFWAALLPFSNIIPMLQLGAERFLYIPTIGFACFCALGFASWKLERPALKNCLLVFVLASFAVLSFGRSLDWKDEISLWEATLPQAPSSPRVQHNLAKAYLGVGRPQDCLTVAEKLWKQCPTKEYAAFYGFALCRAGRSMEGVPLLVKLKNHVVLNIVGAEAASQGQADLADYCFKMAMEFAPDKQEYQSNLKKLHSKEQPSQ
ncbi:MAG: hypothetical protein A2X49_11835 [Lentisphaerae bacterium GWF2_52_8]|nr:MAG: hypothetical protein A2X49_11835 [Lentisphaerae bacterium GWF2_52_8]